MLLGSVGDRVIVESERVGESAREGVILQALGTGEGLHYRVRWEGGHESVFYPSGGSISIIPKAKKSGSRH
jgi:Domain of unknown function (DUF1918)